MSSSIPHRRVVIVGGGLAGTATAIRILRGASAPLEVQVWERRPDFRGGGPAYHRAGNPWGHIFNIQAGRMSLFREDTFDFVRWANDEADRQEWPPEWHDTRFEEHSPAPRRLFHDYLDARLARAAQQAEPGVVLTAVDGEVVDLVPEGRHVQVRASEPGRSTTADHVVVATGLELRDAPYSAAVRDHPGYVREPFSRHGLTTLQSLPAHARVFIVGSVLSAYDSVNLLLRRGHRGDIFISSGSGTALRAYPEDHTHEVIQLPAPVFGGEDFGSRPAFLAAVNREWQAAQVLARTRYPGIPAAILSERVAKAWEPHAPEILARLEDDDLRALLAEHGTAIATLRVGAMPQAVLPVDQALAEGRQVHRIVGVVTGLSPTATDALRVEIRGPGGAAETLECDLVIDSFGREPNYERVSSPLWKNLVAGGTATPHRRTRRGLEVDPDGHLMAADHGVNARISLVGGLREGDEIVRNGRSGAFSLNLAAIKNHSLSVGLDVVNTLEFAAARDPRVGELRSALFGGGAGPRATTLARSVLTQEILLVATGLRDARPAIRAQRDHCLAALTREMPHEQRDHLHLAVRLEAARAMCDVSVTPKALTRILGLGQAAGDSRDLGIGLHDGAVGDSTRDRVGDDAPAFGDAEEVLELGSREGVA